MEHTGRIGTQVFKGKNIHDRLMEETDEETMSEMITNQEGMTIMPRMSPEMRDMIVTAQIITEMTLGMTSEEMIPDQ